MPGHEQIRVGWFLNAVASPTTEATPEAIELIRDSAEAFLRCGGAVSFAEYQAMTLEERTAFEAAFAQLRLEQAAAIAAIVAEWKPAPEKTEEEKIREALNQKLFIPTPK